MKLNSYIYLSNSEEMKSQKDWQKNGFKSEKDYHNFLQEKMDSLMDMIKSDSELLNVFKRLKDK